MVHIMGNTIIFIGSMLCLMMDHILFISIHTTCMQGNHFERTLYSHRPLKGTGVSIYLSFQPITST
jgi:hypothetical protein